MCLLFVHWLLLQLTSEDMPNLSRKKKSVKGLRDRWFCLAGQIRPTSRRLPTPGLQLTQCRQVAIDSLPALKPWHYSSITIGLSRKLTDVTFNWTGHAFCNCHVTILTNCLQLKAKEAQQYFCLMMKQNRHCWMKNLFTILVFEVDV